MDSTFEKFTIPNSLEVKGEKVFCKECKRWEWGTKAIRHNIFCDHKNDQIIKKTTNPVKKTIDLAKAAKDHRNGHNVGEDIVFEAYKAGYLSMSDAMNSDF